MAELFHEIDEDLRRERWRALWDKHHTSLIGAAVVIVLATAGVVLWQQWHRDSIERIGTAYATATNIARQDESKGLSALRAIAGSNADGYGLLARMQAAALEGKTDRAKAAADYRAVAADGGVAKPYRELAAILAASDALGTEPDASIVAAMAPLSIAPDPWRFSAQELTALAKWHGGDRDAAIKIYKQLADDLDAPQSVRARAAEIIANNNQ